MGALDTDVGFPFKKNRYFYNYLMANLECERFGPRIHARTRAHKHPHACARAQINASVLMICFTEANRCFALQLIPYIMKSLHVAE